MAATSPVQPSSGCPSPPPDRLSSDATPVTSPRSGSSAPASDSAASLPGPVNPASNAPSSQPPSRVPAHPPISNEGSGGPGPRDNRPVTPVAEYTADISSPPQVQDNPTSMDESKSGREKEQGSIVNEDDKDGPPPERDTPDSDKGCQRKDKIFEDDADPGAAKKFDDILEKSDGNTGFE